MLEAESDLKKIKEFCIYYGYSKEIDAENRKEFNNSLLNKFLKEHNIKMIYGKSKIHTPLGVWKDCIKHLKNLYFHFIMKTKIISN